MKSTEVYKEIHTTIFPWLKANGFKKTKSGMLGYYKSLEKYYLVIWFQCSQDGFDEYSGSKFIIELQISTTNEIGAGAIVRNRIPFFLSENDFVEIEKATNEIRSKLKRPPKTYYVFHLAENIQEWSKNKFEKTTVSYNKSSDIWFEYFDRADIKKWVRILEPPIHRIINELEQTEY
jgi:hypothetical protein